jgi:ATP-dependent Lon protease
MGTDMRGDPSAALLEVLDPEQNFSFRDHFLELDFDLSQVMFLATANSLHGCPSALLDRMEIIEVPGYTRTEKIDIARDFLVPKQLSGHGITSEHLDFVEEGIAALVDHYTREAGVRDLERQIAAVCRATAVKLADGQDVVEVVTLDHVERVLGPHTYRNEEVEKELRPGVATGLSSTPHGGRIMFVEASKMPGHGKVVLTGNMRNVMQEAATAAVSYVRSKATELHLDPEWLKDIDLHVHARHQGSAGDAPSAGLPMFAAVASLMLDCPLRPDVALCGEISLRGRVLKIRELTQKLLAAHHAGINEVLVPERNRVDLDDVPRHLVDAMIIRLVGSMEEVLPLVLAAPPPSIKSQAPPAR